MTYRENDGLKFSGLFLYNAEKKTIPYWNSLDEMDFMCNDLDYDEIVEGIKHELLEKKSGYYTVYYWGDVYYYTTTYDGITEGDMDMDIEYRVHPLEDKFFWGHILGENDEPIEYDLKGN